MKVCLFLLAVGVFVGVASVVDARSEEVKIDSVLTFFTAPARQRFGSLVFPE